MPKQTPMPAAVAAGFPVLVVIPPVVEGSGVGQSALEIQAALQALGRATVVTHTLNDAEAAIESHPALSCVVLSWSLASETDAALEQTRRILARIRAQASELPVLLGTSRNAAGRQV